MANLVDMTMETDDSQAKEAGNAPAIKPSEGPKYPYGLALNLDKDTVEKLSLEDCQVGDEYDLIAKGKITSMSENDTEDGQYNKSVTLQLTSIGVSDSYGNKDNLLGQDREKEVMSKMEELMGPSIAYTMKKK